ncbi:MAG TPA: hypothetical protein VL181_03605 [Holophagaceae bacterium]|nr:hypothetical protein [Holophagaceae bacterium]
MSWDEVDPKLKLAGLALVALLGGWALWPAGPVSTPPGVLASDDPAQTPCDPQTWQVKDYRLSALAAFSMKARVLSTERYHFDRESDLAPEDVAFGWGQMSDTRVLDQLDIGQSDRWYHWSCEEFPISRGNIETHSANMHLIPADNGVRRAVLSLRPGQVVSLKGYLVRADAADGWHWVSSLTRNDTGAGACEVIYVQELSVEPVP